MFPIINRLDNFYDNKLVWSGQHYDYNMVKKIFADVDLRKPDYFIKLSKKGGDEFVKRLHFGENFTKDDLKKYEDLAMKEDGVFFAGRLGTYKYNNMDTTVENCFKDMEKYV